MYPNTPQQPIPSNYLDQIAPHQPKRQLLVPGPRLYLMIAGLLVLIVAIVSIVINISASSARQPLQQLAARLQTTEDLATAAQVNLKSSQLRSLNSNLQIFLANTNRDIATPLKTAGVTVGKLDPTITRAESGDKISARLEDARLNAIYDRTYAREMAYQLETTLALMERIYDSTKSTSLRTFLEAAYKSLEPTQKSFAEFNASNG